ncbi:hypothetical protein [Microlunatus speluncae]|nr:hypothetical protein [Microlunatus speluncae]
MIRTEVRRPAEVDLESAGPSAAAGSGAGVPAMIRLGHSLRLWLARALS